MRVRIGGLATARLPGLSRWRRFGLISLFFLTSTATWALDPSRQISQYVHSTWTIKEGFLPEVPESITQTPDGYLWIGTNGGLFRFDGVRFSPWSESSGEHLSSGLIHQLLTVKDGSLWIADNATSAQHHLHHWSKDRLVTYYEGSAFIWPMAEDAQGAIWYMQGSTREQPGLFCRVFDDKTQCYGKHDGIPISSAEAIVEDTEGFFWLGGSNELIRWKPGSAKIYRPEGLKANSGYGVTSLVAAPDGSVYAGFGLAGAGLGLERIVNGRWEPVRVHDFDGSALKVTVLRLDRENSLWAGTLDQGIYRIHDDKVDHFTMADGLTGNSVLSLYEDNEGNVWVGTTSGLDNFRGIPVASVSSRNGLCTEEPDSVLAARDGTIWVGGAEALCALRGGRFSSIVPRNGLPGHQVSSLFEDSARHLWFGVDNALYLYEKGRFSPIARPDGSPLGMVQDLIEDTDHNLWAETSGPVRTLFRIRDGKVRESFPAPAVPPARRIAADPRGGIWLGLMTGDLARYRLGHLDVLHYPHTTSEVSSLGVRTLTVTADGTVYGATDFGVIAWKNGRQQVLNMRSGLPCNEMFGLVFDRKGDLWLYAKCGLLEVPGADLQSWWENPNAAVHPAAFTGLDGAWPRSGYFQNAAVGADGKLWFVNSVALQMVDPDHLSSNPRPPPVHVELVTADQKHYSLREDLRLPARTRDLEIDYTALSFVVPQRVRFRYKLEGRDVDWQDGGTRRQAFYTDLRPRKYRFRVIACNNDGLWNTEGATLEFSVAAGWYQTVWFYLAAAGAVSALLFAVYRVRIRQVAASLNARFDERLEERTRIARDLHDTLLQTIQGSKLVADDALKHNSDAARMHNAMEQMSEWLGHAIAEGRAALSSLRSSTVERNDLAEALRRAGEECQFQHPIEFFLSVEGENSEMHPIVRDEVYRIGYEAIRNACAHSGGSRVDVGLSYLDDLVLRVSDNGKGINTDLAEKGKGDHFGLTGMYERAARLDARLTISGSSGAGTEVQLVVPGRIAFHQADSGNRPQFRRIRRVLPR
jgi:signal transduction histidine kinase/ligand-binding sensor domain-containing protein